MTTKRPDLSSAAAVLEWANEANCPPDTQYNLTPTRVAYVPDSETAGYIAECVRKAEFSRIAELYDEVQVLSPVRIQENERLREAFDYLRGEAAKQSGLAAGFVSILKLRDAIKNVA